MSKNRFEIGDLVEVIDDSAMNRSVARKGDVGVIDGKTRQLYHVRFENGMIQSALPRRLRSVGDFSLQDYRFVYGT